MTRCLEMEPVPNVDACPGVVGMNRCKPSPPADGDIDRRVGAVVGAIALLHRTLVALPVPLVVSLLLLVMVVMVIVVGLSSGAHADAPDGNQKRSSAETLSKRHGRTFD